MGVGGLEASSQPSSKQQAEQYAAIDNSTRWLRESC